jgi:hypothetical protein
MADKRISQLIERTDIANNDVLPIVASGATTTNKVTISTIQDWMQDNLDVGVTSVGITLGTTGTDVNVSGSPITTSGNITINIPDASATARGVVTTGTQTIAGIKTFTSTIRADVSVLLAQAGTALPTDLRNISGTGLTSSGSNGFGFNSGNNIYFSGSDKGGGIISFSNTGNQTYTLQNASGTLAFTSDIPSLAGYVTLGTAQTITAQKTFSTSGSSDTAIINHGSGSGIALNITKGGNGEGLRVNKTSGSGNAVTITGGTLSAEAGQFSGDLQTSTRISASSGANGITITPNVGGTQNRIETTGTLPLSLVSAAAITLAAGGTTPQITLATTGAVTLTGALNGTTASFNGSVSSANTGGSAGSIIISGSQANVKNYQLTNLIPGVDNTGFAIRNTTDSRNELTFSGTGAATFSSSVKGTFNSVMVGGPGNHGLEFVNATTSTKALIGGYDSTNGAYIQAVNFGTAYEKLLLNPNGGNVGIGTASPSSKLSVDGDIKLQSSTATAKSILFSSPASNWGPQDSSIKFTPADGTNAATSLSFNLWDGLTNTIERMRITSVGNVGIGTASPAEKLSVLTSTNYAATFNSSIGDLTTTRISLGGFSSGGGGGQGGTAAIGCEHHHFATTASSLTFYTYGGGSLSERMRITSVGNTQPGADNAYSLGVSGTRWSAVWAANGTIQTSDEREKKDIVDSDLGLDLITKLRPVSFKWKVGQNVVTSQVVKDEEGNPILDEEGNEKTESVLIPREGKRTHYGLIAQEVEEVLDGKDFGGFIHDEETDTKGLRYDQFVPLLIKSIQELNDKIAILESKLK